MTVSEADGNPGELVYYVDRNNLPLDLSQGWNPPSGILSQLLMLKEADDDAWVISRKCRVDDSLLELADVFLTPEEATTRLAQVYNQLRIDSTTAVQQWLALRDIALEL